MKKFSERNMKDGSFKIHMNEFSKLPPLNEKNKDLYEQQKALSEGVSYFWHWDFNVSDVVYITINVGIIIVCVFLYIRVNRLFSVTLTAAINLPEANASALNDKDKVISKFHEALLQAYNGEEVNHLSNDSPDQTYTPSSATDYEFVSPVLICAWVF